MNSIKYTLKLSKKARRLRLAIYCDGAVVLTAPHSASENFINQFVAKNTEWILKKLKDFAPRAHQPRAGKLSSRKLYIKHKDEALVLAQNRVNYFNQFYGFKFNKINIRNQKTRWGSCSKKGNLNFNYKIALLPAYAADYIIVHELCHLSEFNHSRNFWNLVAKTIPNYLAIRKELKRGGIC
ncbi:MAG: SprT family zinc-dependent metalloprotease [Patescibacteria group bacterium]